MDAYSVVFFIVLFFLFIRLNLEKGTVINKLKLKHSIVLSDCRSLPVL